MLPNMTWHVHPVVQTGAGMEKISEMPLPVVYVILLQEMADVFPCLRFYLPMSAFMIVNTASTAHQMMYREYHLRLMKSVS